MYPDAIRGNDVNWPYFYGSMLAYADLATERLLEIAPNDKTAQRYRRQFREIEAERLEAFEWSRERGWKNRGDQDPLKYDVLIYRPRAFRVFHYSVEADSPEQAIEIVVREYGFDDYQDWLAEGRKPLEAQPCSPIGAYERLKYREALAGPYAESEAREEHARREHVEVAA